MHARNGLRITFALMLVLAVVAISGCAPNGPGGAATATPTAATAPTAAVVSPTTAATTAPSPVAQPVTQGVVAPDFTLSNLDGQERSLSSYRGQVVMLNFWASWCGYCRSEIPHMNTVYAEFADQGFEIVAVSVGEDPASLRGFVQENEMAFPVLPDTGLNVAQLYQVTSVPTSYFLDADGTVQQVVNGAVDEATLRSIVQSLLDE